jgi:hypothetical protein
MSLKEIENESHPDNRGRNDQFKYTHSHTCVTRQTCAYILYLIKSEVHMTCMNDIMSCMYAELLQLQLQLQ